MEAGLREVMKTIAVEYKTEQINVSPAPDSPAEYENGWRVRDNEREGEKRRAIAGRIENMCA